MYKRQALKTQLPDQLEGRLTKTNFLVERINTSLLHTVLSARFARVLVTKKELPIVKVVPIRRVVNSVTFLSRLTFFDY